MKDLKIGLAILVVAGLVTGAVVLLTYLGF